MVMSPKWKIGIDQKSNNVVTREDGDMKSSALQSLEREVSPPLKRGRLPLSDGHKLAAVESGEIQVEDPFTLFSNKLSEASRPQVSGLPRIDHEEWRQLYQRNLHTHGRHFVIHQHDHPVAGLHYDLRLQCNATSSISFAIMYGLPGDPQSRRLNRNASETRVHTIWVGDLRVSSIFAFSNSSFACVSTSLGLVSPTSIGKRT